MLTVTKYYFANSIYQLACREDKYSQVSFYAKFTSLKNVAQIEQKIPI